jgi:hypothetical protein
VISCCLLPLCLPACREKRQEELARHEREREARAQSAQWEQQVAAREAEKLEHEEHYLQMGDAALKLMKE